MADHVESNPASGGAKWATDEVTIGSAVVHAPRTKIGWGQDGTYNDVDLAAGKPLPVQLRGSSGTELATAVAPLRTDPTGTTTQPVSHAAASQADGHSATLGATTDAAAPADTSNVGLVALFKRLLQRLTTLMGQLPSALSNGNLKVSLQESGVTQTVSGSVSVSGLPATTNAGAPARTSDYDTGAGTDTVTMWGIALPASGGAVAGGTSSNPLRTDPTGTTTQPVSGSVSISSSVTPGTAATNLGKAEDAAHADGDVGVMALAVRKDSAAALAGADADYIPLIVDGSGRLWTNPSGVTQPVKSEVQLDYDTGGGTQSLSIVGLGLPASGGAVAAPGDSANGLDVDVTRMPALVAGTALVGQVAAGLQTGAIYSGATALTPKFSKISGATAGDNQLVAAVASKRIRVHSIAIFGAAAAVSIHFTSGAGGTAIFADATNKIPIDKSGAAGAGGFVLGFNLTGWFETAAGDALVLNLSAAQGVCGGLTYTEV